MQLPGWNSIDAVSRIHVVCEVLGLVSLALLVFFDVLAFVHGSRRETLQIPRFIDERVLHRNQLLPGPRGYETRIDARLETPVPLPSVQVAVTGKAIKEVNLIPLNLMGSMVSHRRSDPMPPQGGIDQVLNAFSGPYEVQVITSEPDDTIRIALSIPK